jgi:hypothetical protein
MSESNGDPERPPPAPAKPPLLDYPTPAPPDERDSERWSEVARALLIVFGVIGLLFFIAFGVCGVLGRGCG